MSSSSSSSSSSPSSSSWSCSWSPRRRKNNTNTSSSGGSVSSNNTNKQMKVNRNVVTAREVLYGECRKNHAARIGGYAVDGCREFMAAGSEGTLDALCCAACGCHRNFHRRLVVEEQQSFIDDCSSDSNSPP